MASARAGRDGAARSRGSGLLQAARAAAESWRNRLRPKPLERAGLDIRTVFPPPRRTDRIGRPCYAFLPSARKLEGCLAEFRSDPSGSGSIGRSPGPETRHAAPTSPPDARERQNGRKRFQAVSRGTPTLTVSGQGFESGVVGRNDLAEATDLKDLPYRSRERADHQFSALSLERLGQ